MSPRREFVAPTTPRRWAAGREHLAALRARVAETRNPFPGIAEQQALAAGLAATEARR